MTIVFPKNNLPEPAQPWAREVQKQLANVIASNNSNEINNATRDNQLNSSLISLSKVANDASSAINGLLGLSSPTSEYSVNASNISAGTITGSTVQTSTTTGVSLNNATNSISFRVGSTTVGHIVPLSDFGIVTHFGSTVDPTGGTFPQVYVGGTILALNLSTTRGFSVTSTGCSSRGPLFVDGSLSSNSSISGSSLSTSSVDGGVISGTSIRSTGVLGRTELATGDITGASFNTNGNLFRTGSSIRFKTDVSDLNMPYESIINAPNPKIFRLKDEVFGSEEEGISANENARYYAGFIAEDFVNTDLSIFVSNDRKNGEVIPSGFYYPEFTSVLLLAIKHQDTLIKSLNDRITTLENGAN